MQILRHPVHHKPPAPVPSRPHVASPSSPARYNSSGVSEPASLAEIMVEHLDRIFNLNVRAMILTIQHGVRLMSEVSSVVLVGSIAVSIANPGYAACFGSKAAVRAYAHTWNSQLATRGIRVNTLSPGPTDTPMFSQLG